MFFYLYENLIAINSAKENLLDLFDLVLLEIIYLTESLFKKTDF